VHQQHPEGRTGDARLRFDVICESCEFMLAVLLEAAQARVDVRTVVLVLAGIELKSPAVR
jgi:hypothetical protein